jgi:FtsP/CotA-like multicopper oxidase with cupredoxin domain
VFSEHAAQNEYFINGKMFDMNRVDVRVKLNTVKEWTILNTSDEEHSFHVHTNHFQLMSINGQPHDYYGWQDTASVPAKGQIVIRTHFLDYTGRTVMHCHILKHQDLGMMAVLEIDP